MHGHRGRGGVGAGAEGRHQPRLRAESRERPRKAAAWGRSQPGLRSTGLGGLRSLYMFVSPPRALYTFLSSRRYTKWAVL